MLLHVVQITLLLSTGHKENLEGEVLSCVNSVLPRHLFFTSPGNKTLCMRSPFHLNQFNCSYALEENRKLKINSPQMKSPLCQFKASLPFHTKRSSKSFSQPWFKKSHSFLDTQAVEWHSTPQFLVQCLLPGAVARQNIKFLMKGRP